MGSIYPSNLYRNLTVDLKNFNDRQSLIDGYNNFNSCHIQPNAFIKITL